MKIHIHPSYPHVADAIKGIVCDEYKYDKVYCNRRNFVAKLTIEGKEYVVKKFKRPIFLNRIVYTYFRKTKARRAYENAVRLLEAGVDTPFPVAYVEHYTAGLFHSGYLLTEYLAAPTLENLLIKDIESHSPELELIEDDLIQFTITMNKKGVLPRDYNGGNIFYSYDDESGHYKFALTDVNRVTFNSKPSTKTVIRLFEQMGVSENSLCRFMTKLASIQNDSARECMYEFLRVRVKKDRRKSFIKRLKKLFRNR